MYRLDTSGLLGLLMTIIVTFKAGSSQDVKLTTLDQNSTYAKILVQVSHQFNLSTQQVSCVQLDDNSDCSSLVIGYFVLANETSADVELSGLLAGGQYNITVGASHVSSTDVTFGSLVLCTAPSAADFSSIALSINHDLIELQSSEFKAIAGTLDRFRVSSVTPNASFERDVTEVGTSGAIGIKINDATTNYTIGVETVSSCGNVSGTIFFTVCFRSSAVENLEAYNISRLSVILTWTSPTDGTIAPTHYNITCVPTNGREFLGSATISADESSSHFNDNGTLYFDSKQHFTLLALTKFRCSVEAIFVPGCNYSQFGEVVIHNQIGSNVQFDTSGVSVEIIDTSFSFISFTAGPCNPCTNYTYAAKGGSPISIPNNKSPIRDLTEGTAYSLTVDETTAHACTSQIPNYVVTTAEQHPG
ncbi:uncharacterized protein LOC142337989 [Convolutriloba macropyga]|uniref:uncharacterized protein LOC142337989 n=1 Tax=Convolutriloba macropyga TaxID=536237 RepID=UPI003F51B329